MMATTVTGSRYVECGHCKKLVTVKTFKEHQRMYFYNGSWMEEESQTSSGMSSPINADITLTDHSDTESLHSDVISEGGEIDSSDMEEGNITGCTYIDSNDKGRNVIIYTVITVIILIIVLHKSRKQNFHSDSGGLGALTQRGYSYTDQVSENQSNVMISMLIFWQASY